MESIFVPITFTDTGGNYCRACTKYNDASDMISLFDSNKNIVAEIFVQCTLLELSRSDGLPMHICHICHDQLLLFNTFRLACVEADTFFRNKIKIKNEQRNDQDPAEPNVVNNPLGKSIQTRKRKRCNKIDSPRKLRNENKEPDTQLKSEDERSNLKVENLEIPFDGEEQKYKIPESIPIISGTITKSTLNNIKNALPKHRKPRINKIPVPKFKCDLCQQEFSQKRHIEAHLRKHQGLKPYKCGKCDKSYENNRSVRVHMRIHHNTGVLPEYKCTFEDCDRFYNQKESLASHIKSIHLKQKRSNIRRFTCEICGSSFRNNHLLQKHIFIHTGISKFKCELCQKKFATKYNLTIHMNRHNNIKNHVCTICGLRKATGHELKVHMNYHTREKLFACKFCGKEYPTAGNMNTHIKHKHCGIKSYKCQYCERTFAKGGTLKHHIMTHTGDKPHECKICGKRFIQLTALNTHSKTHKK